MSGNQERSESVNANEKLNRELDGKNSQSAEGTSTEKANKRIMERLESGETSKGVDPDHYLANSQNSLVTRGKDRGGQ
ncbi:hypothetical protein D3H55_21015 [Bacillus salacetis]|uniref:Uncharacterized protein n=1 Tax=Bacillus salacetis TaxID=2315464 RepID=A0A3A1QSR2_9BACI|nr:hypothetical protein [Bacillus salacetis]RIW28781.1 hypothetical protein D3H55_21015 [Bacillus salacetis]